MTIIKPKPFLKNRYSNNKVFIKQTNNIAIDTKIIIKIILKMVLWDESTQYHQQTTK